MRTPWRAARLPRTLGSGGPSFAMILLLLGALMGGAVALLYWLERQSPEAALRTTMRAGTTASEHEASVPACAEVSSAGPGSLETPQTEYPELSYRLLRDGTDTVGRIQARSVPPGFLHRERHNPPCHPPSGGCDFSLAPLCF